MKKLLLTACIINLFFSVSVASQDSQKLDELLQELQSSSGGVDKQAMQPENLGYKSFVQNELQNIFAQIDALTLPVSYTHLTLPTTPYV